MSKYILVLTILFALVSCNLTVIDDEDIIFKKNNPALVVNFYPTAELKSEEALLNKTEAVLDNNGKLKTGIAIYDYKSNPEKDMFKVNLLNMLQK
mgnify:CR=1 FL=1